MSLRSRLLVAIGVIALVALAIADVATYKSLESFLYQRVDQQLEQSHVTPEGIVESGRALSCYPAPGTGGGGPGGPAPFGTQGDGDADDGPSNAIQVYAEEVRSSNGGVVGGQSCPAYVDGHAYTPVIPTPITGYAPDPVDGKVAYFTAASSQAGGPSFRVRASTLSDGDILIVAQPLGDTGSTLH